MPAAHIYRDNYDSHVILRRDTREYGEIRINIRVELRRFDPVPGDGTPTALVDPDVLNDDTHDSTRATVWNPGEFERFRRRFFEIVPLHWNNRLSIVTHQQSLRFRRGAPSYSTVPTALRCTLQLTEDNESPQLILLVVRRALFAPQFRSYMCGPGGHRACVGRTFLQQPAAEGWRGRRGGIDGILDSTDLDLPGQVVVVHEFGHYLGLNHVNVGCDPGHPNAPCEYGVGAYQRSDVMGAGNRFDHWHAWPWLNRWRQHTGMSWASRRSRYGMHVEGGWGDWHGELIAPSLASARAPR